MDEFDNTVSVSDKPRYGWGVFCTPFEGVSHTIPNDCVEGKRPSVESYDRHANLIPACTEVEG